jgi:hypothetical protein
MTFPPAPRVVFGAAVGSVTLIAVLASAALAQPAPQSRTIKCEGPFGRNANHDALVKAFGRNVVTEELNGAEGEVYKASVIYPKDPKARLEILWNDEPARRDPLIRVKDQSTWSAPNGVRLKLSLTDIERMNGKPFKLAGFDWDLGGHVTDWQGGALAKPQPGGCTVSVGFDHPENAPQAALSKVSGDNEFLSNNPNMRAAKPFVSEITIGYPQP